MDKPKSVPHEEAKDLLEPEVVTPSKPAPKQKELYWLAGGIVVVVLFSITSKLNQPSVIPSQVSPTPASITQASPTVIVDSTANWKSYTNQEFKINFKYPPNWLYGEDKTQHNRKGYNIYLRPKEVTTANASYGEIYVWFFKTSEPIKEYIASLCEWNNSCVTYEKNSSQILVGDSLGVKITNIPGPLPAEKVIVKKGDLIIEFLFNYDGIDNINYANKDSKIVFDQILSTFKFIEDKQTINTSSWKTFTSSPAVYTLKYPGNWYINYYNLAPGDLTRNTQFSSENISVTQGVCNECIRISTGYYKGPIPSTRPTDNGSIQNTKLTPFSTKKGYTAYSEEVVESVEGNQKSIYIQHPSGNYVIFVLTYPLTDKTSEADSILEEMISYFSFVY